MTNEITKEQSKEEFSITLRNIIVNTICVEQEYSDFYKKGNANLEVMKILKENIHWKKIIETIVHFAVLKEEYTCKTNQLITISNICQTMEEEKKKVESLLLENIDEKDQLKIKLRRISETVNKILKSIDENGEDTNCLWIKDELKQAMENKGKEMIFTELYQEVEKIYDVMADMKFGLGYQKISDLREKLGRLSRSEKNE